MKVTKLFEITFDEPGLDFLSSENLKFILEAALVPEEEGVLNNSDNFQIRDLTNREQYLAKFVAATGTGEIQKDSTVDVVSESSITQSKIDVRKKNEEIKKRKEKKQPPAPPHNDPGKGILCKSPELIKEKLSTGGSISFCPACGFQYSDTDLLESIKNE